MCTNLKIRSSTNLSKLSEILKRFQKNFLISKAIKYYKITLNLSKTFLTTLFFCF